MKKADFSAAVECLCVSVQWWSSTMVGAQNISVKVRYLKQDMEYEVCQDSLQMH